MNTDQINGILRILVPSVMSTFTGFALAHGFTPELWLSFSASIMTIVATLVAVALSWHSHTIPVMADALADSAEVHKVEVTPALALATKSIKVVAVAK